VTATVGIVGGGQLARMSVQAAIPLGIQVAVLCDDPSAPAVVAGARFVRGRPDRLEDLVRLAEQVDVVTLDHEQVPAALLGELAALGHRVAPGALAARLGQDKAEARRVLAPEGLPVAPWTCTDDRAELAAFSEQHGWPLVVKLPTGGYDGRGVWRCRSMAELQARLDELQRPVLVEPLLDFRHELAVVVVRSAAGDVVAYPPFETVQRDGRCHEVLHPAPVPARRLVEARHLAVRAAEAVDLVGAMAVELFATERGLLLNELAVRPHNSAHLTIEACATSQFENHLRAVVGLPLGATDAVVGAACMVNVVGPPDGSDPFDGLAAALAIAGAHVHRYAKDPRPGRKVGHVTATAPTLEVARTVASRAAAALHQPVEVRA
jgi:5-(carboxyamino)imidazole ribonucleotide synthase